MVRVKEYAFNESTPSLLKDDAVNSDWPVVYVISNDSEAYVGETISATHRMKQHWDNPHTPERRKLKKVDIISDDSFNKSATLDIESSLIDLMSADKRFNSLQNENGGVYYHRYSKMGNYAKDSDLFQELWNKLKKKDLVKHEIVDLTNSNLFKYSSYKALTEDQCFTRDQIFHDIAEAMSQDNPLTCFVQGSAGTGKTILAIYLLKQLVTTRTDDYEDDDSVPDYLLDLKKIQGLKAHGSLKVGYVVAMTSLRTSIKEVFSQIKGLKASMVIGPAETAKQHYDVLIVDEAHRLKQRNGLGADIGSFDETNRKLGFDINTGNQLDWIVKQSEVQILFYDAEQSVKPSDVPKEHFDRLFFKDGSVHYSLESQMRCLGGNDYIRYVKDIFENRSPERLSFNQYAFRLYHHIDHFCDDMLKEETDNGLCRIVAGYAWDWHTKNEKETVDPAAVHDIELEGRPFVWNQKAQGWVSSISGKRIVEEVGCIHTIQGYDLNVCGVIVGSEISYDPIQHSITIDPSRYRDPKGKINSDPAQIKDYILHIYETLCTRGIKGTFLYVCDPELRAYLSRYIDWAD